MRFIRLIIFTIIVIIGVVFLIENLETLRHTIQLKLDLYFVKAQSPGVELWIMILFFYFLGVFTAALYGIYELIRQRQTIRQLRQNLEILGQEVKQAGARAEAAPSPQPAAAVKSDES